jgi:hypothetical protein
MPPHPGPPTYYNVRTINHIAVTTVLRSWRWANECPKRVELIQRSVKLLLLHLVGHLYYSPRCWNLKVIFKLQKLSTYAIIAFQNVGRKSVLSIHMANYTYTGYPRRNVPEFGRVFLMLKYTDVTQNTYVQSWTVTEIMAREKCGLLAGPRTVPVSWQPYPCPSLSVVSYYVNSSHARSKLLVYFLLGDKAFMSCIVLGTQRQLWHECECFCSSI